MTLERDDILRLTKELAEATMFTHALWEKLELIHSEIVDSVRERTAETLACAECDIDSTSSLAVALHQGWTRLQVDDGLGHNYLGLCPFCTSEAEKVPEEPQPASTAPQKPKSGPRKTSLFPE